MFRIWYKGGFEPEYPKWNGKENDKIVWCFRCGGVDYFKVRNDPETFIQRALEAQEIYHELGRGLDRETHIATLTVAIEAFNKVAEKWNKRDFKTGEELTKLGDLLKLMQDALNAPQPTEIIYKLASVMYFDSTEDPTRYDATYAAEKIARWKEFDVDPDVNGNFGGGFFLNCRIEDLISFSPNSNVDIPTFIHQSNLESLSRLQTLDAYLSNNPQNELLHETLRLRTETLLNLLKLK